MKLQLVNNSSSIYPALQHFIGSNNLLFSSEKWLNNFPSTNIKQCAILNNNNDVTGTFTYYEFKKTVFKVIITPPFSPNIDLFYLNPAESVVGKNSYTKDLMTLIAAYFDGLGADLIDLNLPEYVGDTQPFTWKKFISKTRYSYIIDLKNSEEVIWNNLSTEKRKSINKAKKDELEIKATNDFTLVYDLITKSLSRNGLLKNQTILKNILFNFSNPSNSFAFVAYQNGKPSGASFCIIEKNKAVYLFGGFDSDNKHHGAGVSCMWQCILHARQSGLHHFDFEGSMNPAIERYFREFGGKLSPYQAVEKIKPLFNILLKIKKK